nr:retrovirus-related Pol polyprotein from transposon TNT 1-94 [Tanacetum cinerariifolium]GEZ99421.1 retrovirus-related Pol polyprotein from transposon TNT 1-94 [Tanacetum cinerariifolium]
MANLSKDIQCAGSDTRPPMLDRTDFASWKQRIRLYCRGTEGAPHLGPERPRVYSDLSPEEKDRYNADIRAANILLQGLPKDIYTLINHYTDAKDIWDNVKMLLEGSELTKEDRESQLHIARNCTQPKHPQNSDYYKDKMLLMQAQDNGVALDEEQLLFIAGGQDTAIDEDVDEQPVQDLALNVDNVFQADDCDAFDYDINEAPMAQTMFMANLSSADRVNDEDGPSYDSNILSEEHVELHKRRVDTLTMCDKKNSVIFTDTECFVLSYDYKLPNE